jgi:DNA-binding response OmpR family regulator
MAPPSSTNDDRPRHRGAASHRPRILVVEDDRDFAEVVRFELETGGYEVDVTSSVTEAKQWMRTASLDLVISDVNLGGPSGIELLFPEPSAEAPPAVLMMSGFVSPPLRHLVEEKGALLIEKPFSFGRLHASVIGALSKTRRVREASAAREDTAPHREPTAA